jgi:mRNA interferase MazF
VLFEALGNIVIAGVTSNLKMKGMPLTKSEGALKDSVIKLNYIFTISNEMANKVVFHLNKEKNS